ncbi:MAG: hypothetical protein U5R06_01835 [candidate division KSB1 bacterium]|nr:hypothetical protein [candidate division KSB1 bacterium]
MATFKDISKLKRKSRALYRKQNITGMGVGFKHTGGQKTDKPSLVILVSRKQRESELSRRNRIPKRINGIETDVIQAGQVVAQSGRRTRLRPAEGGISIGHPNVAFGTLGAVVRDAATGERLILSCNHVLADHNNAEPGDLILQPGDADGGEPDEDTLAHLVRFVPLYFQTDAASTGSPSECKIARCMAAVLNAPAVLIGCQTRLKAVYNKPINFVDAAVARPLSEDMLKDEIRDMGAVRVRRN